MSKQETAKFNNGKEIPLLGFGTWEAPVGQVGKAVEVALLNGYKHIDCAMVYLNENEVGQTFNKVFNEEKKVKREDVFITSKLWNNFHSKQNVRKALKQTLKDLQLDYLDLYLIHWPIAFKETPLPLTKDTLATKDKDGNIVYEPVSLYETWREMEKLVDEGLVKSIGISNFPMALIYDLLTYAKIKPVCNQIECHPYFNQNGLKTGLDNVDIRTVAYSPLGRAREDSALHDATIKSIAKKHNKTPAQVILRWNIQRGVSVIPKSVTESRIIENSKLFDFELTDEQMKQINQLGEKEQRVVQPANFWNNHVFY